MEAWREVETSKKSQIIEERLEEIRQRILENEENIVQIRQKFPETHEQILDLQRELIRCRLEEAVFLTILNDNSVNIRAAVEFCSHTIQGFKELDPTIQRNLKGIAYRSVYGYLQDQTRKIIADQSLIIATKTVDVLKERPRRFKEIDGYEGAEDIVDSSAEYFDKMHQAYLADASDGIGLNCFQIAAELAARLLLEGESPYIITIEEPISDNGWDSLYPQIYQRYDWNNRWGNHEVCCVGNIAYDTLNEEPLPIDEALKKAFGKDVPYKVRYSSDKVESFIRWFRPTFRKKLS